MSKLQSKKFGIPLQFPNTFTQFPNTFTQLRKILLERSKYPNRGNLPYRGKASAKKFTLNIDGELIQFRTQKSLSISAICAWLKTWSPPGTNLITEGNRTYAIESGQIAYRTEFVYFVYNKDSNAIKIGYAKDVSKRMTTLQTSSPAKLELLKSIVIEGNGGAQRLEKFLYKQFDDLKISG